MFQDIAGKFSTIVARYLLQMRCGTRWEWVLDDPSVPTLAALQAVFLGRSTSLWRNGCVRGVRVDAKKLDKVEAS